MREDPKLITRVINFELVHVQPIRPRYLNVTDRRTDGRTDGRLTIAIPRFALHASHGKSRIQWQHWTQDENVLACGWKVYVLPCKINIQKLAIIFHKVYCKAFEVWWVDLHCVCQ